MSSPPWSPPPGSLVVIGEEATLLTEADAHALHFPVLLNRPEDLSAGHVVEVVGHEGEFVAVKTVEPELGQQCAGRFGVEAEVELKFWVSKISLRSVLSEPTRVEFDDGTAVELVAGTPLSRFGDQVSAHVGEHKLPLEIEEANIALSFAPGPAVELGAPSAMWASGAELRYGEHVFESRGAAFSRVLAEGDRGGKGDAVLLSFANACGRFELSGYARDRVDEEGEEGTQGEDGLDLDKARHAAGIRSLYGDDNGSPPDPCVDWRVAKDAALEWVDGSEAGRTREELTLTRAPLVQDQRACFELVVGLGLCSEHSMVSRHADPSCSVE